MEPNKRGPDGELPTTATTTTSTSGPVASGGRWSRERVLRKFPLLYPTLEGLARYTHLIDVGYFNDLMEVFKQVGTPHTMHGGLL
jgi:hypothetical protein